MEIWLQICENLCIHCHCDSNRMPDFGDPEYARGKSALAALSLTSRVMKEISQPILYHCFYHCPRRNTASVFLRALIMHPRLTSYVKVLSLNGSADKGSRRDTRAEIETWNQVSNSLGLPVPRWILRLLAESGPPDLIIAARPCFDGPGQDARIHYPTLSKPEPGEQYLVYPDTFLYELRGWKQFLIQGLTCASLTHLAVWDIQDSVFRVLGTSSKSRRHFTGLPLNFSNLRTFSCRRADGCEGLRWYLSKAPLLDRLAVDRTEWRKYRGKAPRSRALRALSISCHRTYQEYILQSYQQVRDLEIDVILEPTRYRQVLPSEFYTTPEAKDPWPSSIKSQLRRLCWHSPSSSYGYYDAALSGVPPIRELEKLEILEIDRSWLNLYLKNSLDPDMPEQEVARLLPTVLPCSLRILHTPLRTFFRQPVALSIILIELEELAAAKTTSLPMLSIIQLDYFPKSVWNEFNKPLSEVMENLGVVSAMKEAGIDLRIGFDRSDWLWPGRGMFPRTLQAGGDDEPGSLFPLED